MDKIESIIASIEQSIASSNYFAMLTSSLILIDICSAIEYKNKKKTPSERYKSWIEKYLLINEISKSDYLDATNIWYLRCAMLHEGSAKPGTQSSYEKWGHHKVKDIVPIANLDIPDKIFTGHDSEGVTLFFDITYFVEFVLGATKRWMNKRNTHILNNVDDIFSIAYSLIKEDGNVMIVRKK